MQLTVYNVQLTIMVRFPVEAHGRVTENCDKDARPCVSTGEMKIENKY